MTGIVGIFCLTGDSPAPGRIDEMLAAQSHRGPDGSAVWTDGPIALGTCKLFTDDVDVSGESIPTLSQPSCAITADARLDNRNDLKNKLAIVAGDTHTTDESLILRAFSRWREDCAQYLAGDFAFAIWECQARRLLLARDHLGVRPLYYTYAPERYFAFASDVGALLRLPFVDNARNEGRIADFLVRNLEGIDRTSTFYRDIFRLEPAHILSVTTDGFRLQRYGRFEPNDPYGCRTEDEWGEAFAREFKRAVIVRMGRNSQTASMLSGGIDSSAIVGIARQQVTDEGKELPVFFATSQAPKSVERTYIKAVLDQGGLISHELDHARIDAFIEPLDQLLSSSHDLFDTTMGFLPFLYRRAHENGIKVVLDGTDGDLVAAVNVFYLRFLIKNGKWFTAGREAIQHHRKTVCGIGVGPVKMLYRNLLATLPRPPMVMAPYRWLRDQKPRDKIAEACAGGLIDRDFARQIDLAARHNIYLENNSLVKGTSLPECHARSVERAFVTAALERYDRAAMASSVEARHPFFDKRFVEFCTAMPWQHKVRDGLNKYMLRKSMVGVLPDSVCWRTEFDHVGWRFTVAFLQRLLPHFHQIIHEESESISTYVDMQKASECLKQFESGNQSVADQLWLLLGLWHWLKRTGELAPRV